MQDTAEGLHSNVLMAFEICCETEAAHTTSARGPMQISVLQLLRLQDAMSSDGSPQYGTHPVSCPRTA